MKETHTAEQFTLFPTDTEPEKPIDAVSLDAVEQVSFRELVPEIKDSGYLTHAIYAYPAKFIPQVVRYAIHTYTQEGDWIVDPFAGSGTVGVEAYLCNRNAVLLDLNVLLNHTMPLKVYPGKERLDEARLYKLLAGMQERNAQFRPAWSNVDDWYAPDILEVLSHYWGFIHQADDDVFSWILKAALLKVSQRFSNAEGMPPKLERYGQKMGVIAALLKTNWREQLVEMVESLSLKTLRSLNNLVMYTQSYHNENTPEIQWHGGVDASDVTVPRACDALITSPPDLQAQEYIRSTQLELLWLGYTEAAVKELSRLEIPYRKADRVIQTETLDTVRKVLTRDDLQKHLDAYFCHSINALENAMAQLKPKATACIFVDTPRIDWRRHNCRGVADIGGVFYRTWICACKGL